MDMHAQHGQTFIPVLLAPTHGPDEPKPCNLQQLQSMHDMNRGITEAWAHHQPWTVLGVYPVLHTTPLK